MINKSKSGRNWQPAYKIPRRTLKRIFYNPQSPKMKPYKKCKVIY